MDEEQLSQWFHINYYSGWCGWLVGFSIVAGKLTEQVDGRRSKTERKLD